MTAKVVTFDGDQTLWDFRKAMRAALGEALVFLKESVAGAYNVTIEDLIHTRDQVAREIKGPHELIRKMAFKRTLEQLNVDDAELTNDIYELYMERRFSLIEPYPDALKTLQVLCTRYRVGLISNGNTYPERCGFEGYFHFTVFSHDVGVNKPDPKIFNVAASRAGCQLSHMVHVGDGLDTDVAGAKGVGAKAVWLNRDGVRASGDVIPDIEVSSLAELLPLLMAD